MKAEGRVQTEDNKELCEAIRKRLNATMKATGVGMTYRRRKNEVCTKLFNDLYSKKWLIVARADQITADEPVPDVMWKEVEYAVKQIKEGKTPGCDNIRSEHLKASGLPLFKALAARFSR
uniref:Transposase n=1 Tax=Haemonchus contortus TaxID=6289 RepID=A0A7I4YWR4_HAECO